MAKFRANHENNMKPGRFFFFRLITFFIVLIFLLAQILKVFKKYEQTTIQSNIPIHHQSGMDTLSSLSENWKKVGFPSVQGQNVMVTHTYYALSYSESDEQAEWVAYILSRDHLNSNKLRRFNYFNADDLIPGGSSTHFDYMRSGYTRGHLAPASDMSFDSLANKESFYMSNISPQVSAFNKGIWRELEENVRDWARTYKNLFIVTGPVLSAGMIKKIGKNKVSVPFLFYKVILNPDGPDAHGIGFIIPNAISDKPLSEYVYSVDSVEHLTGIDFFNTDPPDSTIEAAERSVQKNHWPINQTRFIERVEIWNKK